MRRERVVVVDGEGVDESRLIGIVDILRHCERH